MNPYYNYQRTNSESYIAVNLFVFVRTIDVRNYASYDKYDVIPTRRKLDKLKLLGEEDFEC